LRKGEIIVIQGSFDIIAALEGMVAQCCRGRNVFVAGLS
jgi:hypothetical protein